MYPVRHSDDSQAKVRCNHTASKRGGWRLAARRELAHIHTYLSWKQTKSRCVVRESGDPFNLPTCRHTLTDHNARIRNLSAYFPRSQLAAMCSKPMHLLGALRYSLLAYLLAHLPLCGDGLPLQLLQFFFQSGHSAFSFHQAMITRARVIVIRGCSPFPKDHAGELDL